MKKAKGWLIGLAIFFVLGIIGGMMEDETPTPPTADIVATETTKTDDTTTPTDIETDTEAEAPKESTEPKQDKIPEAKAPVIDLNNIPAFSGKAYVSINNNIPYFTEAEHTTTSFEKYSRLDSLGRCGVAFANIGTDIMPTGERGSIGSVKPSGWQTIKYENVDGKYLYNRCHLIGFQLSGENANEQNLITGTRYLNMEGMLPFENMVADYVKETNNHVLYRVTPIYDGNNLLASGVLMEALSVEDDGEGIKFNVFCYNEQPGITINHANGNSEAKDGSAPYGSSATATQQKEEPQKQENTITESSNAVTSSYIGNKNTKKFHYTHCSSVKKMKDSNKAYLECTRDQAISQGYSPCGNCNP